MRTKPCKAKRMNINACREMLGKHFSQSLTLSGFVLQTEMCVDALHR